MKRREDLIKTKEFWMEKVQNHLFASLQAYMEKNNLDKAQIAKQIGVELSYISNILNGNFDGKLSRLIELALSINRAPVVNLEDLNVYIQKDKLGLQLLNNTYITLVQQGNNTIVISQPSDESFDFYEIKWLEVYEIKSLKALRDFSNKAIIVPEENEYV